MSLKPRIGPGVLFASLSLAAVVPAWAQKLPGVPLASKPAVEQYLLLGNATRDASEPIIAINPTNTKNIVVVAMGNLQLMPGVNPPVPYRTSRYVLKYQSYPYSTTPWVAVTQNGGRTWNVSRLPVLGGKFKRDPDPFVGVTAKGVFIAGANVREVIPPWYGENATVFSTNEGRTWSARVNGINSFNREPYPRFAPGLEPIMHGNSPWARPFLKFDDQTGVVYLTVQGGLTAAAPVDRGHKWRRESYFAASRNDGRSWGTIFAADDAKWPQLGSADLAAGHGTLAEVYVAASVPSSQHARCPCEVFGISRDAGHTFVRHVMRNVHLQPHGANYYKTELVYQTSSRVGSNGSLGWLAADPVVAGRYSVLSYSTEPTPHFEVATSDDYGKTWSQFVAIGSVPGAKWAIKPWLKYSRFGVLGLEWRAVYANYSYDVWAAISKDGGRSFSSPLRISSGKSRGDDYYRDGGNYADDFQDLAMSRRHMYVVWADFRSGFRGTWIGRVPLSSFHIN